MNLSNGNLGKLVGRGVILTAILSACGTTPTPLATQNAVSTQNESVLIKSLQKQLRDREKRIEELESQLKALKVIDQDFDKRKKPLRPPAILLPIE